jgi:hypothetical protein
MRTLSLVTLALLGAGCSDAQGSFYLQQSDAPFIYDIGELEPIDRDGLEAAQADITSIPASLHYGQLGAGENQGVFGGATYQFAGTGGRVCVVVDPEAVFWNRELSTQSSSLRYKYDDVYSDDGDIDISVGLTAYYTGSPGEEIGDFQAVYTDPAGVSHELEFNECVQTGYFGDPAHAGRATVEYCEIDTSLRPGIMYTVVLETFALPIDDSVLSFGTMVFDGRCDDVVWTDDEGGTSEGVTECAIPNEVEHADPNGLPEGKEWFPDLERAFCAGKGKVNSYCGDNIGAGCNEPTSYTD